jgi:hypothetical protein
LKQLALSVPASAIVVIALLGKECFKRSLKCLYSLGQKLSLTSIFMMYLLFDLELVCQIGTVMAK